MDDLIITHKINFEIIKLSLYREEQIGGLDVWDGHGCRFGCKFLEMLQAAFQSLDNLICVVCYPM